LLEEKARKKITCKSRGPASPLLLPLGATHKYEIILSASEKVEGGDAHCIKMHQASF